MERSMTDLDKYYYVIVGECPTGNKRDDYLIPKCSSFFFNLYNVPFLLGTKLSDLFGVSELMVFDYWMIYIKNFVVDIMIHNFCRWKRHSQKHHSLTRFSDDEI